jgi:ADP-heptose:LPS heptosyltransferase
MSNSPTLIVLRGLGLGDFLTGVPAYRALAAAFPAHRRWLAAPAVLEPLLPLVPVFEGLLPTDSGGAIRGASCFPDVAVNLHGRGPESHRSLLRLGPRRLIAFAHPEVPESAAGPLWSDAEHEVARWCHLLQSQGIAADASRLSISKPLQLGTDHAGYPLIHPGAASLSRRWPLDRWAAVARGEMAAGRAVLATAGPGECELAFDLAERLALDPRRCCAVGESLYGLASLVARAGLVLCGDTGVAHLATALRRPSVVLFGPTSPARWGPPPNRPWHRVLWAGSEGDPHAGVTDSGLLQISVIDVEKEIAALRRSMRTPDPVSLWGDGAAQSSGWG